MAKPCIICVAIIGSGLVMSGRIWAPPDCNRVGRLWSKVTTADVYSAS
jgi:hypothetical protein